MNFEIIDRPEKNRHRLRDDDLNYDFEIESALMRTLEHGRAIKLTLALFHSSPAKGRLWLKGYRVRHRVLEDREHVAAWLENENDEQEQTETDKFFTDPTVWPSIVQYELFATDSLK